MHEQEWRPEAGVSFLCSSPHYLLTQGLSLNLTTLAGPASPRDPPVSVSPLWGIRDVNCQPWFLFVHGGNWTQVLIVGILPAKPTVHPPPWVLFGLKPSKAGFYGNVIVSETSNTSCLAPLRTQHASTHTVPIAIHLAFTLSCLRSPLKK